MAALHAGPSPQLFHRVPVFGERALVTALCVARVANDDPSRALRLQGIRDTWSVARRLTAVLDSRSSSQEERENVERTIEQFVNATRYVVELYKPQPQGGVGRAATSWERTALFRPGGFDEVDGFGHSEGVIRIGSTEDDHGNDSFVAFVPPPPTRRHAAPAGPQRVVLGAVDGYKRHIATCHDVAHDGHSMYSALFVGYVGLENVGRALSLRGVWGGRSEVQSLRQHCLDSLSDDDLFVAGRDGNRRLHPDVRYHFPDVNDDDRSSEAGGIPSATQVTQRLDNFDWAQGSRERFALGAFARLHSVSIHIYNRGGPGSRGEWRRDEVYDPPGSTGDTTRCRRVIRLGCIDNHFVALLHFETAPIEDVANAANAADVPNAADREAAGALMNTSRTRGVEEDMAPGAPRDGEPSDASGASDALDALLDLARGQIESPAGPRRSSRPQTPSTRLRNADEWVELHDDDDDGGGGGDGSDDEWDPGANDEEDDASEVDSGSDADDDGRDPGADSITSVTNERSETMCIKTTLNAPLGRSGLDEETKQRIFLYFILLVRERSVAGYWCSHLVMALVSHDDFDTSILDDNSKFSKFMKTSYRVFIDTTGPNPRNQGNIDREDRNVYRFILQRADDLKRRGAIPERRLEYVHPDVLPGRWLVHQKAADTHKTAFANHLWMNYEGRLHVLLQTPPYELHTRKHRVEILNAVMGRQTRPGEGDPQFDWQSNPPLLELIRTERERFTVPEADRNWRGPRRALTDGEAITEVTLKVRM